MGIQNMSGNFIVRVVYLDTSTQTLTLAGNWTLADLKRAINPSKFDTGPFVVGLAGGKQITWGVENPQTIAEIKKKRRILQIGRCKGGNPCDDRINEIEAFLSSELPAKYITQAKCNTCWEIKLCVKSHGEQCQCCVNCFKTHLKSAECLSHTSYKCVCGTQVTESAVEQWGLPDLAFLISELNELRKLNRLMQWQVHTCGAVNRLESKYCKQTCPNCKKDFCFFCNGEWSSSRTNQEYFCGNECYYYSLTQSAAKMIAWTYSGPTSKIPPHRFCPQCNSFVGYARKCKNHQCEQCKYWFCFFCLEQTSETGHNYNRVCPFKPQSLADMFSTSLAFEKTLENQ